MATFFGMMKIDEIADVFLNSVNFWQHSFSNLAPSSSYTMNLKTLTKVSKVEHLSFHMKYCILHLNENSEKTNFISLKKTPPKSPHQLGLKQSLNSKLLFKVVLICLGSLLCQKIFDILKSSMCVLKFWCFFDIIRTKKRPALSKSVNLSS